MSAEAERAPVEFEGFTFPDTDALVAEVLHEIARAKELAKGLEDANARVAELEAGLRTIAQVPELDHWAGKVARDLLAGRAAGGEG